jgi:serine/threonine-protein kinase
VLDFGIAKAFDTTPSVATDLASSPTYVPTNTPTMPGVVMGTAGYLSPEQARGRSVDKRTDIFSFGCLLFEMLAGKQLFPGETVADSLGATLHREPTWEDLPGDTPPTVLLLLRRCLTKERQRRLHDIADARVELEDAISDPTGSSLSLARSAVAAGGTARAPSSRMIAGVLLGLVLGAVGVGALAAALWPSAEPKHVRRLSITSDPAPQKAAISPDGTMVAFATDLGLHLRRLSSLDTRLLWAEENEIEDLYWSPDSEWIGFRTDDQLQRIAARGGQPIDVAEVRRVSYVQWSDDGHLRIGEFVDGTIIRIRAQGGAPTTEIPRLEDEMHLHGGAALPAGRGTLFSPHRSDGSDATTLCVWTGGKRRTLFEWDAALFTPEYSPSGHILFIRNVEPRGTWALPFSLDRLEVTGDPFLVAPGADSFSTSRTGDLLYLPGVRRERGRGRPSQLVWMDRDGQITRRFGPTFYGGGSIELSPDGTRVALSARGLSAEEPDTEADIWIVEVQRGTASRLAAEDNRQWGPSWSPDGRHIAYLTSSGRSFGNSNVVARLVDGSGAAETIAETAGFYSLTDDWSTVAYVMFEGSNPWDGTADIMVQQVGDPSTRRVCIAGPEQEILPLIRPGGGLIAYLALEPAEDARRSRVSHLFIRPFPEGEGRWQVSMSAGGVRWSRSGDRLFFIERGDEQQQDSLMEMPVTLHDDGRVELGEATPIFTLSQDTRAAFDVAPDGDSFLMLQNEPEVDAGPGPERPNNAIIVVENWYEEFRGRSE